LWRTTWYSRDSWFSDEYNAGRNGFINTLDKQNGVEKYAGPGGY